jgi:hypothetical protein
MGFSFQKDMPDDIMNEILSLLTFEDYLEMIKTCNRIKQFDGEVRCSFLCTIYDVNKINAKNIQKKKFF